jgi:hypothetical protein
MISGPTVISANGQITSIPALTERPDIDQAYCKIVKAAPHEA